MALSACEVLRNHPTRLKRFLEVKYISFRQLHGPPKVNEHSDVPLYPPIPPFKDKHEANSVKTKSFLSKLGTVEEKQYQINRPKYYGWYSYMLTQNWIPSDSRDFLQFATQTHVTEGLPEYYTTNDANVDTLVDEIAPLIEEILINHSFYKVNSLDVPNDYLSMRDRWSTPWPKGSEHLVERKKCKDLVKSIHNVIMVSLAGKHKHLKNCSEDVDSRNDAFWFRGGIGPDKKMLSKRLGNKSKQEELREKGFRINGGDGKIRVMSDDEVLEPYERALQYKGKNLIQLRMQDPLPPFIDRDSPLVTETKVPIKPFDPRTWGFKAKCQHGTNVPGCWPDAEHQHGLLMYCERINKWNHQAVSTNGVLDNKQSTRDQNIAKALLSCFGWLLPQACHLGFSPLTDITYPLATQATVTDGQVWSYFAYQLNTTDLTRNSPDEHTHNNVLWAGEDQRLYDSVEDGKVVNFTPSALVPLIKMYLREPRIRDYNLTPYLNSAKTVANFHEPYQRKFLFENIRHIYSNRPRHFEKPEIYMWEKINLIDHPGPFAIQLGLRRRRWFQMAKVSHLGKEHWHPEFMSLDDKRHRYIPKALRPEDYMRKKGLGRRYNKWKPKLTIPLEDRPAVYKLPTTEYNPKEQ